MSEIHSVQPSSKIISAIIGTPGCVDHIRVGQGGVLAIHRSLGPVLFIDVYYGKEVHRWFNVVGITFENSQTEIAPSKPPIR